MEIENIRLLYEKFPEMDLRPASEFKFNLFNYLKRVDWISKLDCDEERKLSSGKELYVRIAKNGKFGILHWKKGLLVDKSEIIVPCKYDYIFQREGSLFKALQANKSIHFDLVGRELDNFVLLNFPEIEMRPSSDYDIPIIFFNSKVDFIEVPPKDMKGPVYLRISKKNKLGLMRYSPNPKIIIPCEYEYVYPEENGFFKVRKLNNIQFFDKIGKLLN